MKNINAVLIVSGILLGLLNLIIIYNFGLEESRWTRFASVFFYFLLFLYTSPKKEKYLEGAFGLLLLSDLLMVQYEQPLLKKGTFLMVILAYLFLIFHITPLLKKIQTSIFQNVIFLLVMALNCGMLFILMDMVEVKIDDAFHSTLFYFYGIMMILLVSFAFSFTNRYSSNASFFFICAVLGFVFSDISGFIAYYMEVGIFYFPDRLFYLLGLMSLVKFSSLERTQPIRPDHEWL